jgi:transcriptional regulator with XRE-family HTH domain
MNMAQPLTHEKKSTISDAIRKILSEKGLTVGTLAELTDVKSSTVRNWIQRNRYPREHLRLIAQEIGLEGDIENPGLEYEFEWLDITRSSIVQIDNCWNVDKFWNAVEEIRQGKISFNDAVRNLFSAMGPNDEFYYISLTEVPFEMSGDTCYTLKKELHEIVAKANSKGALFKYILPGAKAVEQAKEQGYIPRKFVCLDREVVEFSFDSFKKEIEVIQKCLPETEYGSSPEKYLDKISLHFVDLSCFLIPFHKIVLFKHGKYCAFSWCESDNDKPVHGLLKDFATKSIKDYVSSFDEDVDDTTE